MRNKLHVRLIRKRTTKNTTYNVTGEDIQKNISERARKILDGENIESKTLSVNTYF